MYPSSKKRKRRNIYEQRLARTRAALRRVIEIARTQQAVADQLGVSQAAVSKWLVRGWVPVARAREIEAIYGVPRMSLIEPGLADALAPVELGAVE